MNKINRPSVSIVRLPSGDTTYAVSHDEWSVEYVRRQYNKDEEATIERSRNFLKQFDQEADVIEAKGTARNIMGDYVAHGLFMVRRKLSVDKNNIEF